MEQVWVLLPEPTTRTRGQLCVPLFEHGHTDWVAWAGGKQKYLQATVSRGLGERCGKALRHSPVYRAHVRAEMQRMFQEVQPSFRPVSITTGLQAQGGKMREEVSSESPTARPTRSTLKNLS